MHADTLVNRFLKLTISLVLLATVARVWLGPWDGDNAAQAQIPNAGQQRKELVDEVRRLHAGLDRIHNLLETHTFKVVVRGSEGLPGSKAVPNAPRPSATP